MSVSPSAQPTEPAALSAGSRRIARASVGKPDGERLAWADLTRGAAIILVVYFHATLFLGAVGIDDTLGRAKAIFELFPLPAFFLISGIFGSRGIQAWSFREVLLRRVAPLAYVYVLWSVLRFLMFSAFPALPARDTDIPADDPLSLALLPVLPASLYWFLYALMLFTVVAWLVRRVPRWIVLGGSAVLSTAFTSGLADTDTIAWNRIGALLFFFLLGVAIGPRIVAFVARAGVRELLLCAACFLLIGFAVTFVRQAVRIPFVVLVGQCLALATALVAAKYLARVRALRFIGVVGRASLPIYLGHLFAIAPAAYLLSLLHPSWSSAVNVAVTAAVAAVAVVAGLGLAKLATWWPWLVTPPFPPSAKRRAPGGGS